MSNKLQELTDRLYAEGLSKGKQEGEEIIRKAKAEEARILAEAERIAAEKIESANREAEEIKKKVYGDVKLASAQSLSATRQEIENLIVSKAIGTAVNDAMKNGEFVKEIIRSIAAAFNPANAEPVDLNIVLPESLKAAVEPFIKDTLSKELKSEIHTSYSKRINGGFTVGPKNGGYFISFTDEEFNGLIAALLRPATRKILFEK